ncbi:MAG: CHAP domain-containing protein [Salinibacterium sp.]|nr:MAG: CHAP domain-containing protein [Salinibacterium sp.]
MEDRESTSAFDALFNFSAPDVPAEPVSTDSFFESLAAVGPEASAPAEQFSSRRAARNAETSRPRSGRAVEARAKTKAPRAARSSVVTRKLDRSELAALGASAGKISRENPIRVFFTMVAVAGMLAVFVLPAYSQIDPNASANGTTANAQRLTVSDASAPIDTSARDAFRATTSGDLAQMTANALRAQANAAYLASGARAMGDDYPWFAEPMDYQGGGLSPVGYYYRECVDFVAWRMNRDAGSYTAPFKWTWSTLTPYGGNGSQWKYNWQKHGWPVKQTPVVGAVAYVGGNHVAYVKRINGDGTVLIEEYNYIPGAYGQRTLKITDIDSFLYPPP